VPDASSPPAKKSLHVAIIPDGNRRWAKAHRLQAWQGHQKASGVLRELLTWCKDNPAIGTLTVWGFSTENWKRDPELVAKLMELLEQHLKEEMVSIHERHIHVVHSGRKDRLSPSLATLLVTMEEETKTYDEFTLHLALDYGGKDEIVRAVRHMKTPDTVTEESFRSFLDHPELPDIDCLIRTAGEKRISNFFLWQGAYAELIFLEKFFPDLTITDMEEALAEYRKRTRRFGK